MSTPDTTSRIARSILAALVATALLVPTAAAQVEIASALENPVPPNAKLPNNPFRTTAWQAAPEASPSDGPVATETISQMIEEKPLWELGADIESSAKNHPEDKAGKALRHTPVAFCDVPRHWPCMTYTWEAAATRHNPLYFEEINAERYGYGRRCLQPVVSTAHFFGTIPLLPYLKGANCPWECQYTLGHYRPGSCHPYRLHSLPLSCRGAAMQAGAVTGLVYIIP